MGLERSTLVYVGRDEQPPGVHPAGSVAGYRIYDQHYEKVVDFADLFVGEDDRPEYLTSVCLCIPRPIIGGVLAAFLCD